MAFGDGGPASSRTTPDFAIDLYHAEAIDDDMGEGLRLYTLEDTVYEARRGQMWVFDGDGHLDGTLNTRIYQDGSDWMLKAQTPVTEKKPAYHALRGFANTVEEELGVELETTWLDYQTTYEDGKSFQVVARDASVTFRHTGDITVPKVSHGIIPGITQGVGAAIGGGAAAVANLFGVPADIFGGYLLGMGLGAGAGVVGPKARQFHANRKRRKTYGTVDGMEELDLFDRVNEQHRLEQVLDRPGPAPDHFTEEYNALREDEFEDIFDIITTAHFEEFHKQAGVTLTGTFDTYSDAYGLASALSGVDPEVERPSIYTEPDVFQHLFSYLTYTEGGEDRLLGDGETLVREVMQRDADPAITEWLDEEYGDLVRDVARQHSLDGDTDG